MYNDTPFFYEDQMVMLTKSNLSPKEHIKPENHRTEKYDYWTAMVASIMFYIRSLEVKNIPFKLTVLEERFKPKDLTNKQK